MVGLRRVRGFRSHLLCTPLTASWLSKLESAQDRVKLDAGFLETPVRPFRTALKTAQLVHTAIRFHFRTSLTCAA